MAAKTGDIAAMEDALGEEIDVDCRSVWKFAFCFVGTTGLVLCICVLLFSLIFNCF